VKQHVCPNCGPVDVGQQIGGKLALSLGGIVLGSQALKEPIVGLFLGLVGLAIGNYIDAEIAKKCPQCGAILAIADFLL
jgi:hypothetical protein